MVNGEPCKGWLHGIPIAIKDLSIVQGIPMTLGELSLFQNCVPDFSDALVQRLINAGVIVIGKTNTPKHGIESHTYNSWWGTTSNPFDLTKSASGSSGGASVAIVP